ncbi:MAG: Mu transposase C-terminal domain-containing protein, partial [Porcipelethomonas sp.]
RPHPQNKKMCYMIPVSALSEELQAKYYGRLKAEINLPALKEDKKPVKKPKKSVSKTFEEMSEAERREANVWSGIIEEWLSIRSRYENKAQADKMYVGKCQLEHPELQISRDILYRKLKAYKSDDVYGLIDKRGAWNKGASTIPPQVWDAFLWYWLDDRQPTAAKCYRGVIDWTEEFYPELVSSIPSLRTFQRHIESDVQYAVKVLMRDGEKAFKDRCLPYMIRLYDKLEANDCWIADNHTLDIQSLSDENTIHRLYLTAFLDAKSGVLVGWNITETPNSQSTLLALRHAINRFGIPKCVYFDNGREFLTHDVAGMGHRKRKNIADDPPTIIQRLGIEMKNALVRNAKAKPIERTFGTVKSQFSKAYTGYCGGTILERPESLKRRIKNGELPRDYEIRDFLDTWIDGDYNLQPYGGAEPGFKGMTRLDVWNKSCKSVRQAKPEELNLMMMRSTRYQKIKRNGVYVEMFGEKLWYMDTKETVTNLEKEVYVRYDPADLRSVRIYDKDDKYLYTWNLADQLLAEYISEKKEEISDKQKYIRTVGKFVKEQANGISASLSSEQRRTMLDLTLRKSYEKKKELFKINLPTNIIPIIANEPEQENVKQAAGAEGAVIVDINLKRMERNGLKRKER